jgi:hypothetical protein
MNHSAPISKSTRTTWRTSAREIAEALGLPLTPQQWVTIESHEDYGDSVPVPLSGIVDVVRWERCEPSTYQHELATHPEGIAPA